MNWWRRLLNKGRLESELDRELQFHLERHAADLVRDGLTEQEARRRARIALGGLEQVKEECREARGTLWLEATLADLRFALRTLRQSPVFAVAAAGTLALGIGANTAIFSVANAVFLRPLPYEHPERLVWATEYFPRFKGPRAFTPEYAAWRRQNTCFERLEAYGIGIGVNLTAGNLPAQRIQAGHVTPGYFQMLGVQPRSGRAFRPEEDRPGASGTAVVSDAVWRNYLHTDPRILGTPITLNGRSFTVIGVMPAGFVDPAGAGTGVWLPDAVDAKSSLPGRSMRFLGGVIGRLKPGVTPGEARANLEVIARRMDNQYPAPWSRYHAAASVRVLPLQEQLTNNSTIAIRVLMGAAGFILLIVCANVANMFLSRVPAREREIAIRAAMGASRSRVVRLLLMESLLVGACGGLAGLAVMYGGIPVLGFLVPEAIRQPVPIDARVVGFAAFCALGASLLFGLSPALAASRLDLNASLKEGGAHPRRYRGGARLRGVLAVAQIALSLVLLVGAGLLLRSFMLLARVDPGFNPRGVLLAEVSLAPQELYGPARQAGYFRRALEAIRRIPGVEYAAATDESPLATFQSLASGLAAEGEPPSDAGVCPTSASEDYFQALEIPLLAGRFFDGSDREGTERVAIINRALARTLFQDRDPVGRRIRFGGADDPWVRVIGVVGDIRHRGLDEKIWPELFQPYQQAPSPWMSLVVKASTDPEALIPAIRKAVAAIDRHQPLFDIQPLARRLADSVADRRQRAFLLGSLALVALTIAVVGVYGVVAYSVTRRMHEIGVRMALGAQRGDVLGMVVAEGLRIALAGVVLGLAGAMGLTRVVASFLYGVTPTDALTFVSVCAVLILAACLASYVPARRATRVDPMAALRHE